MIFYFSATGNSKYVAERIAEKTSDTIKSISDCVENNLFSFSLINDENIGIISPTYFWGLPKIVKEFISKLEINNHKYAYFISTYGTTTGQSGYFAQKEAKKMKFSAFYCIKMPDTWTPVFDLSNKINVENINKNVEPQINKVIDVIQKKTIGNYLKNKIPLLLATIYYNTYDLQSKTNKFTVDNTCIGCGLCAKKCPSHAIEIQNKKPVWIRENCIMCLGCLHRCPKFSIQYGKNTKKHGQYTNPNTKI